MTALTAVQAAVQAAVEEATEPDAGLWQLGDAELLAVTGEYLHTLARVQALGSRLIGECERRRAPMSAAPAASSWTGVAP